MPIYEHHCDACEHEWEDLFKMSDPVPKECPSCHKKGKIRRLISWCSGTVELTGHERTQKLWNDGKKIAQNASKNEKELANIIGEEKYHKSELAKK